MKKIKLLDLYRFIVGSEFGWSGEGNEQWYYFLALVMNLMLTWWLKPELGVVFTICSIVHYITVCVYGSEVLFFQDFIYSVGYFVIHLIILIMCLILNWKWTLLTSFIVIISVLIAPNCMGNNIFMPEPKPISIYNTSLYFGNDNVFGIFFFHTIWFAIFVIIALYLPINIWLRLMIIILCMVLHPIIDFLEGDCMNIADVTNDAIENTVHYFR